MKFANTLNPKSFRRKVSTLSALQKNAALRQRRGQRLRQPTFAVGCWCQVYRPAASVASVFRFESQSICEPREKKGQSIACPTRCYHCNTLNLDAMSAASYLQRTHRCLNTVSMCEQGTFGTEFLDVWTWHITSCERKSSIPLTCSASNTIGFPPAAAFWLFLAWLLLIFSSAIFWLNPSTSTLRPWHGKGPSEKPCDHQRD